MTQKTQARRNRSLNQMFSVILEEIGMFAGKAMSSLIVWMKGDVRETFPWTQLVMLFEHGPDSFKIVFRLWSDHLIGGLISSLGNHPGE